MHARRYAGMLAYRTYTKVFKCYNTFFALAEIDGSSGEFYNPTSDPCRKRELTKHQPRTTSHKNIPQNEILLRAFKAQYVTVSQHISEHVVVVSQQQAPLTLTQTGSITYDKNISEGLRLPYGTSFQ